MKCLGIEYKKLRIGDAMELYKNNNGVINVLKQEINEQAKNFLSTVCDLSPGSDFVINLIDKTIHIKIV